MNSTQSNSKEDRQYNALGYATLISLVFSVWFLKGFFSVFVLAGTIAYLFYPTYRRLARKLNDSAAAAVTALSTFVVLIIPIFLVGLLGFTQLRGTADKIPSTFSNISTNTTGQSAINGVNEVLKLSPVSINPISESTLIEGSRSVLQFIASFMLNNVVGATGALFSLFTSFIVYVFVLISLLKNGKKIVEVVARLNPLGPQSSEIYLSRVAAMVKGVVQGQFAIAAIQGLLGAIAFAIAGYAHLFFVIFTVFTVFSIVPLGAGILAIPLGVIMIIFGNIPGGLVVIFEHVIINSNVDNIIRPILVSEEARLDPALMLVSVFAGIGTFGFLGIIIGPTLMIIAVTTLKLKLNATKSLPPTKTVKKVSS